MVGRLRIAKNRSSNQELKALIDYHTKELAATLWKLDHPGEIINLETIERVVREQVLTHVSPQIALFLWKKQQERQQGVPGH